MEFINKMLIGVITYGTVYLSLPHLIKFINWMMPFIQKPEWGIFVFFGLGISITWSGWAFGSLIEILMRGIKTKKEALKNEN